MTDYHYKDLADEMLANFRSYASELCEANERKTGRYEFSSQQMLKKIAQQNPDAYIRWLERCRVRFPDYIFNKTHEDLGRAIARRAEKAEFEKFEEGRTETDIFDNPTGRITYRPKL